MTAPRQYGLLRWRGQLYRVADGNTAQPAVYLRYYARAGDLARGKWIEYTLPPHSDRARTVVSLFRRLADPGTHPPPHDAELLDC